MEKESFSMLQKHLCQCLGIIFNPVYIFCNVGCVPAGYYRPVMRGERLHQTLMKNCCLRIKLLPFRLWNSTLFGNAEDESSLIVVCIDAEGNTILLVIDQEYASCYRNIIKEGHVYIFKNLDCVAAPYYRPVMKAECLRVNSTIEIHGDVECVGYNLSIKLLPG